jgi:hypothetical protein
LKALGIGRRQPEATSVFRREQSVTSHLSFLQDLSWANPNLVFLVSPDSGDPELRIRL